jgi:hypothetical protein
MRSALAEMEEHAAVDQAKDLRAGAGNEQGKANPCVFDESEFGKILEILAERPPSVAE